MQEDADEKKKLAYKIDFQEAERDINQAAGDINIIKDLNLIAKLESKKGIAHSSDLKDAIRIWRDSFPRPQGSGSSSLFALKVDDCEKHPLYSDLINHLPQSGFDICSRWEKYKNDVNELDETKKYLLLILNKAVSDIFPDLALKFVEFYDFQRSYDYTPPRLNDFECCLPRLIFERLLFDLDIDNELKTAKTREEYEEIVSDIVRIYDIWRWIEDRVEILPVTEKDNSIIWGEDGEMELIRVPKKDSNSLKRGKEKAVLLFLEGSPNIEDIKNKIFKNFRSLEKERAQIIKELDRSLYCQCYSGECRYLGN
jgi:hypothetical protein